MPFEGNTGEYMPERIEFERTEMKKAFVVRETLFLDSTIFHIADHQVKRMPLPLKWNTVFT